MGMPGSEAAQQWGCTAVGLHSSGAAQQWCCKAGGHWGCTAGGVHSSWGAKQWGLHSRGTAQQGDCTAGGLHTRGLHSKGTAQQGGEGHSRGGAKQHQSNNLDAYLNFQVVVISTIVALPQVLLVEHHTVHWLPWTLHIAAQEQTES